MKTTTIAQRLAGKGLASAESEALGVKLSYSIRGFSQATDIGRTKLYGEISAGRLRARKAGKRTIITTEDGRDYLASLPAVEAR